jgi:esterase/lipase superfamily enzyme
MSGFFPKGIGVCLSLLMTGQTSVNSDVANNTSTTGAVFKDSEFNFQFLRTIGYASSGGADINECLDTAYRIKNGDIESWYQEWNKTASRLEKTADEFLAEGHNISAREAYFRASNYYRNAGFYLDINPDDQRIMPTWEKSRDCFLKAASLSDNLIRPVRIPFENTTLPGYLCLVDASGEKRPLLIVQTGYDGTGEELYFQVAKFAVERGYNVLIFEGPGQGEVIRVQKIPFRYNWESVVTPVVDYALNQSMVDPDRIALMGISFGGYLAPRAIAFEHRIKACIANSGVYDFNASILQRISPDIEEILSDENESKILDQEMRQAMNQSIEIGWAVGHGMYVFGAKTPSDYFRMLHPYTLKGVAPLIKCKMLVIDSDRDTLLPGQAKPLYDALTSPKEFMLFTSEEGAGLHCQTGAVMISNERILNWLDGGDVKSK